jgi:hypothetical protein
MKQIIFTTLFTILLTANQEILEDLNITTEDTNITQIEDVNLSELSEDELMAELMKLEEQISDEEAEIKFEKDKTKFLKKKSDDIKKLSKTVDKLVNHLDIEN